MSNPITPLRSYRATLAPAHVPWEDLEARASQGALPTVQLKAANPARAELAAAHVTGMHVLSVVRVEGGAA